MCWCCIRKSGKSFRAKILANSFQAQFTVLRLLKVRELGLDHGDITTLEE